MTEERADALAHVIEKHLPGSARELDWLDVKTGGEPPSQDWGHKNAGSPPPLEAEDEGRSASFFRAQVHVAAVGQTKTEITRFSKHHARVLLWASEQAEGWFGASFDEELLQQYAHALRQAHSAFEQLSSMTKVTLSRTLSLRVSLEQGGATADSFSIQHIRSEDVLEHLMASTKPTFNRVRAQPPARRGRGWSAAAVADASRKVWAIEKWMEGGGNPSATIPLASQNVASSVGMSHTAWDEYLETTAPQSAKDGGPGPFGRFLEDVLEVLGIEGKNGEHLSAASALRASLRARTQLKPK